MLNFGSIAYVSDKERTFVALILRDYAKVKGKEKLPDVFFEIEKEATEIVHNQGAKAFTILDREDVESLIDHLLEMTRLPKPEDAA